MTAPAHAGPGVWTWLAQRRKAIVALLVPLALGLASLAPGAAWAKVVGVIVTALVSAGVVHQVPNTPLGGGG